MCEVILPIILLKFACETTYWYSLTVGIIPFDGGDKPCKAHSLSDIWGQDPQKFNGQLIIQQSLNMDFFVDIEQNTTLSWMKVETQTNTHPLFGKLVRLWYNYASVLITIVFLTFLWRLGLAHAARRISTTFWWPLKLAVHSGVSPSCFNVC